MSNVRSAESFIATLRRSNLVDSGKLSAVLDEAGQSKRDLLSDPIELARFLVEKQTLTEWQADKLLQGKHKGYYLGKYRLLSLLGKGGMSAVYLAEHMVMKRQCAIKVLPSKRVTDSSYLGRFHREAQAVASLNHPNIVRAYDVDHQMDGETEIHFLVMEYVDGLSLQDLVARHGVCSFSDAVDYVRQAALGLDHAHHMGMVHRDIKPGNLLVDSKGVVRVLDLGLAMFFNEDEGDKALTIQHDEKVLGTADYLAPEQAVDSHLVDARADQYSLGCTLYYLLTGHPPFTEGTLTQRLLAHQMKEPPAVERERPGCPSSLVAIVRKLMAKKADDRYPSAKAAADAMTAWLEANADADWQSHHSLTLPGSVEGMSDLPDTQLAMASAGTAANTAGDNAAEAPAKPGDPFGFLSGVDEFEASRSSILSRGPSSKKLLGGSQVTQSSVKLSSVDTERKPGSGIGGKQTPSADNPFASGELAAMSGAAAPAADFNFAAGPVAAAGPAKPVTTPKPIPATKQGDDPSAKKVAAPTPPAKSAPAKTTASLPVSTASNPPAVASAGPAGSAKGVAPTTGVGVSGTVATQKGTGGLSAINWQDRRVQVGLAAASVLFLGVGLWGLGLLSGSESSGGNKPAGSTKAAVAKDAPPDPAWATKRETTVGLEKAEFAKLSDALVAVRNNFFPAGPEDRFTIKVAAGTYDDRISIDGAKAKKPWPTGIVVQGDGAAVLAPKSNPDSPVVRLREIRQFTLQGLKIDAAKRAVAIEVGGYLQGTRLQDLRVEGYSAAGVRGVDSSGLFEQEFTIDGCRFSGQTADAIPIEIKAAESLSDLAVSKCRFVGPLSRGVVIAGLARAQKVYIGQNIFSGVETGIELTGTGPWVGLQVVNNTFQNVATGVEFLVMPDPGSREISFQRNLFLGTKTTELSIRKGLAADRFKGFLLPDPEGVRHNWSDREAAGTGATGFDLFSVGEGRRSVTDVSFESTDVVSPGWLRPASGSPALAVGSPIGREQPWVGALGPATNP
jgi:eukaryotic-like serine/threonine-protein kinase